MPIRAGTDIAFLGGLINYVLDQRARLPRVRRGLHQRGDDRRRGLRRHRGPRRTVLRLRPRDAAATTRQSWQYDGATTAPRPDSATRRRHGGTDASRPREAPSERRSRGRRRRTAPAGRSVARKPQRDETLQHPRCVFQILKRHFARYTPEMVQEVCGIEPEQFRRGGRGADQQQRPRAHDRVLLRRRLDPPHRRRRRYIRTAVDPAAAAGQHRPPGRRHPGPARARQHPGLDRHPDAVQPAARLPADAARRRAPRRSTSYVAADAGQTGFWGNIRAYTVSLLKAYWGDAATAENDFCFDYLPRLTGDHGTYQHGHRP